MLKYSALEVKKKAKCFSKNKEMGSSIPHDFIIV